MDGIIKKITLGFYLFLLIGCSSKKIYVAYYSANVSLLEENTAPKNLITKTDTEPHENQIFDDKVRLDSVKEKFNIKLDTSFYLEAENIKDSSIYTVNKQYIDDTIFPLNKVNNFQNQSVFNDSLIVNKDSIKQQKNWLKENVIHSKVYPFDTLANPIINIDSGRIPQDTNHFVLDSLISDTNTQITFKTDSFIKDSLYTDSLAMKTLEVDSIIIVKDSNHIFFDSVVFDTSTQIAFKTESLINDSLSTDSLTMKIDKMEVQIKELDSQTRLKEYETRLNTLDNRLQPSIVDSNHLQQQLNSQKVSSEYKNRYESLLNEYKLLDSTKKLEIERLISKTDSLLNIKSKKETMIKIDSLTTFFKTNSFQVIESDKVKIKSLIDLIKNKSIKNPIIMIKGYTDQMGSDDYNFYLSYLRANAVKKLILQSGFNKDNLFITNNGKRFSKDLSKDRKVEITVYQIN